MHYYLDGYNLLFRIDRSTHRLQDQRLNIIQELNEKAKFLNLSITIVFDAHYQNNELTRTHYDYVEILFSASKETADERILEEIRNVTSPRNITVVTSDKKLAWFARRCMAKTESVEIFIKWLNKRFINKIRHLSIPQTPFKIKPIKKIKENKIPKKNASIESCFNYYLDTFSQGSEIKEISFKEIEIKKEESIEVEEQPYQKPVSEIERWQLIFEKRLENEH